MSVFSVPCVHMPNEVYIQGDEYKIEFLAHETMGGTIGDLSGLARARFDHDTRSFTLNFKCQMAPADLLAVVKKNRALHVTMREEALEGYCAKVAEACSKAVASLQDGSVQRVDIRMYPPEDHTHDYDRAIKMLEMTQQPLIDLDEGDFASLVNDDWAWLREWVHSNRRFSQTISEYGMSKKL